MEHQTFRYKTLDELMEDMERLNIDLPVSKNLDVLGKSIDIGEHTVANRLTIHPMEGADGTSSGKPDELTFRRYERFARGGAGLLWLEASAVVNEGRANPRQLYICQENRDEFKKLLDNIRSAGEEEFGRRPYTVVQLTHSGRYSRPKDKPAPIIAAKNPYLDKFLADGYRIISDDELKRLEDKFVEGAVLAKELGFDAIDVKSCHRYIISELLSAFTRDGEYGGSFENRTRFLLNIVDKVRDRLGDGIEISLRLNVYDAIAYPYGFGVSEDSLEVPDLKEPIELVKMLSDRGVRLINLTTGNPYYNPHVNRPYDIGPYLPREHPLRGVARMLGIIRDIQSAVPEMAVISTGFSWLRHLAPYIAAGGIEDNWFKLAGFGRQAFAYPDFARDILEKGEMEPRKCCISCSKCTEIMRDGGRTGCVIKDAKVYMPIYREGRAGKPPADSKEIADHL
ncbi:MAG: flavin oxidoreductase/NADH oxidase [Clostridiales bacterium]|nr:flavin oxidoreductase/NADH oxidase [Clostridiales bacterium]